MQKQNIQKILNNNSGDRYGTESVFSSNGIRLSAYEWMFVGIVVLIVICFGPGLWGRIEKFDPEPDYRIPYQLSYDYWFYEYYSRRAGGQNDILVIGDSVIWGHYVPEDQTLSAQLNKIAGTGKFVNLGVDGIHPAALFGLLKYYGNGITNDRVILHFNPLWLSSEKHDLQTEKEYRFNHPRLVPQFSPEIACYRASFAKRISTVIERRISFLNWISHLKIMYFESMDLTTWTLEHPYENPFGVLTLKLPVSSNNKGNESVSWIERRLTRQDFQWVNLDNSLQWRFFRQTVELLESRGNKVFVLVGPFNEHILTGGSDEVYGKIKSDIELWLRQKNIPYYIPQALPSELYADASHPLSKGYAMLANQLYENPSFKTVILSFSDFDRSINFAASGLH